MVGVFEGFLQCGGHLAGSFEPRLSLMRALGDEWASVSLAVKLKGGYLMVQLQASVSS